MYQYYKESVKEKPDNVVDRKLLPTLNKFLETLNDKLTIDFHNHVIDELEFLRRDGFIPHSHNRGGLDLICYTSVSSLVGSGHNYCNACKEFDALIRMVKEENPSLNDEKAWDEAYELGGDDYSLLAFRVRIMYEGSNKVAVHYGWDTDAPYFRWNDKVKTKVISFKNKRELTSKLNKLIPDIIKTLEK